MSSDLFILDGSFLRYSPPDLTDLDLSDSLFTDPPFDIFETIFENPNPNEDQSTDANSVSISSLSNVKMQSLSLAPITNSNTSILPTHGFQSPPPLGLSGENFMPFSSNGHQGLSSVQGSFIAGVKIECTNIDSHSALPNILQRSFSSQSLDRLSSSFPLPVNGSSFQPGFYPSLSQVTSQLLDLQANAGFGVPMRRVCSTGDLPRTNRMQTNQCLTSPLASENSSTFVESGYRVGRYSAEERKKKIHRYRSKRTQRNFTKKIKYACRKTLADSRPRIRGRFARSDETGEIPKAHEEDDDEADVFHEEEEKLIMMKHKHGGFGIRRGSDGMLYGSVPICPKYQYFGF